MIELLLKNGADPHQEDANKQLAIDYAIENGDVEITQLLQKAMKERSVRVRARL